jgi:hypothetical protein
LPVIILDFDSANFSIYAGSHLMASRVYETRGRSREQAADHIGIGVTKFDQMIVDGRMPEPRVIDGRVVWCVYELDEYFDRLPRRGQNAEAHSAHNPWADQRTA